MSGSHDKLPKLFWVQIILIVIVGALYLLAPKATKQHVAEVSTEVKPVIQEAQQVLQPIGKVETKAEAPVTDSSVARSGESIYKETCATCHASGIANAPKLDDKAAWESRMTNGIDGLIKTAIAGKGAMPARGGNPTITDEEMKEIVLYMTSSAGIETSAPAKTEDKEEAAPTTVETSATAATTMAKPLKAPNATESTASLESVAVKEAPAAAQAVDLVHGEEVYKNACFACHAAGVAGAPKLGDIPAWSARIAAGNDVMYNSAINGKGVMPPKGGYSSLSDDDVKAAVDYMIVKSK